MLHVETHCQSIFSFPPFFFIYFWLCRVFLFAVWVFSSLAAEHGDYPVQASHCRGFSSCGAQALGRSGFMGRPCGPEEEKLKLCITSCSFCFCNPACSLQSLDHIGLRKWGLTILGTGAYLAHHCPALCNHPAPANPHTCLIMPVSQRRHTDG